MTSYIGYMETLQDGLLLIEAARTNRLPKVRHRLSQSEYSQVQSGSIFIWNENEVNIKRWTDGRNWSNSRLKGRFLIYKEIKTVIPMRKKTLCARTITGEKYHVVCYYYDSDLQALPSPKALQVNIPSDFYFVGGENSPLLQYDPLKNETIPPTIDVPFIDHIKASGKHNMAAMGSSPDSGVHIHSRQYTAHSASSCSTSPRPAVFEVVGKQQMLPPLSTLISPGERRFRIDEDYIKLLHPAMF